MGRPRCCRSSAPSSPSANRAECFTWRRRSAWKRIRALSSSPISSTPSPNRRSSKLLTLPRRRCSSSSVRSRRACPSARARPRCTARRSFLPACPTTPNFRRTPARSNGLGFAPAGPPPPPPPAARSPSHRRAPAPLRPLRFFPIAGRPGGSLRPLGSVCLRPAGPPAAPARPGLPRAGPPLTEVPPPWPSSCFGVCRRGKAPGKASGKVPAKDSG